MSYELSLAGLIWVITRHDAQPRREEGERGRQGGHAGCVDAWAAAPRSNQALEEEARDPLGTLTEGGGFSSVLIKTPKKLRWRRMLQRRKGACPILHSRHQGACAVDWASVSAQGKGSWRDRPCILSRSSSCSLCYYFLLLHIICTPQQAIVPFHWLFISLNSLWGRISVRE